MKTQFTLISMVLLFSLHAAAGVFSFRDYRDEHLFRKLLREFPVEVRGFDQTKESPEVVDAFTTDWNNYISGKKPLPEKWKTGYSWSKFVNEFLANTPGPLNQGRHDETEKLKVKIDIKAPHSIEDAVLTQKKGSAARSPKP